MAQLEQDSDKFPEVNANYMPSISTMKSLEELAALRMNNS
jgi:hypothetical protein